jgi:hypothetical protein
MSGETVLKPDKDHSSEVDKLLPETEALAKVLIDHPKPVCRDANLYD